MAATSLKEENYLKSIINLSLRHEHVGVKHISDDLKLKMPSVNAMMKKLALKGYVTYESYKPITLTQSGRLLALSIIRKHRLTEMFLVKVMGLGWEEVHDIAEQLEHIKSPVFFEKMDDILGHPSFDPHGSPIPDTEGVLPKMDTKLLAHASIGETVKIKAVTSSSQEFLIYLNERGITIGSELEIVHIEKFDQSMRVIIKGKEHTLSQIVTQKLLIEN